MRIRKDKEKFLQELEIVTPKLQWGWAMFILRDMSKGIDDPEKITKLKNRIYNVRKKLVVDWDILDKMKQTYSDN
jgi:hypothetical protein